MVKERNFENEARTLKMRSAVTGHQKLTTTTDRIIETGPLTTTREVAQELNIDHPLVVWHLKQIGKVKRLYKWVPHELPKNKRNDWFEMSPSLILHNSEPILWHMTKTGIYMTVDNDQLSGWTEKLQSTSQSQACTKKGSWSLFGGLLLVWSSEAFWILVKPLHLRNILSKLMRCTKNCNACSQHWSTEKAQFFPMITPDHTLYNQCFKSWMNWTMKFCLIHHIHLVTCQQSTTSRILTTFCKKITSTTSRMKKILSKTLNHKAWFLPYRNKQTYFSLEKMYWM